MYFSYLALPTLPDTFYAKCLENVKLIGTDPRLEAINNYRGPMNRATFLPYEVNMWIIEKIILPLFGHVPKECKINYLNVTTYQKLWKREETWGTHPKHVDIGRSWALNYYFDTGGDNTTIRWYENDTIVAETRPIKTNQWCLLKVNQYHDVRGIEENKIRYFITLSIAEDNIDNIKSLIDPNTVIQ